MQGYIFKFESEHSVSDGSRVLTSQPLLRMKPQPYFSGNFERQIADEPSDEGAGVERKSQLKHLDRFAQWNIVLTIVLIGVPLLLYCIISSAG